MPKIKLKKQVALDILDGDTEQGEVIQDDIDDKGRWSVHHTVIFKVGDKFLKGWYSVGATEQQDEGPWEYTDEPEFAEVEPYEKTIIDYRPVKD